MLKILLATHGDFAKGALTAAEIILGKKDNITCINAYSEAKNVAAAVDAYMQTIAEQDQVLVLTDLFGGSVNQVIMQYLKQKQVCILAGFNLAVLLEVMMLDVHMKLDTSHIRHIVDGGRQQLLYVNDRIQQQTQDDFDL